MFHLHGALKNTVPIEVTGDHYGGTHWREIRVLHQWSMEKNRFFADSNPHDVEISAPGMGECCSKLCTAARINNVAGRTMQTHHAQRSHRHFHGAWQTRKCL